MRSISRVKTKKLVDVIFLVPYCYYVIHIAKLINCIITYYEIRSFLKIYEINSENLTMFCGSLFLCISSLRFSNILRLMIAFSGKFNLYPKKFYYWKLILYTNCWRKMLFNQFGLKYYKFALIFKVVWFSNNILNVIVVVECLQK